jgi:hypothetical protein
MPDLIMVVDTALPEVPVNLLPLLDDTDFKTRETAVAYNAAGMDLVWNFVTEEGVFTQTAVTPTSGGVYDWTHQGDGMYTIEIPDSGGASINNNAIGYGWFAGFATGVLPWRGPVIAIAAVNTAKAALGLDKLQVHADEITAGLLTATAFAANAINAAKLDPDVTTELQSGLATASALSTLSGKVDTIDDFLDTEIAAILAAVDTEVAAILADTNELQTDWANGGRLDLLIDAIKAKTDALPSDPADASVVAGLIAAVETKVDTVDGIVDAILVDTAEIGAAGAGLTAVPWNAAWDAEVQSECTDALNAYDPPTKAELDSGLDALPTAAENAAALMDLANGIETSITPRQAIRLILAASAGKLSGAATTTVTIRNVGDSKDRITATVDSAGNRSAVTVDAT